MDSLKTAPRTRADAVRCIAIAALLSTTTSLACMSTVRLYKGEPRPDREIAIVKMVTNGSIVGVNQRAVSTRRIELLPGTPTVRFRVIIQGSEIHDTAREVRVTANCTVELDVEAGREYQITRSTPKSTLEKTGDRTRADRGTKTFFWFNISVAESPTPGRAARRIKPKCRFADT